MSVTDTSRVAGPFTANGVLSTFPFEFKVLAATDVTVEIDSVAVTTGFAVTLNADQDGDPGGEVVFTTAPTSGSITISSDTPLDQPAVFANNGGFYPRVLNDSLDRLTIIAQEQARDVGRGITVPLGEEGRVLPASAARANAFLYFDADGNPVVRAGTPVLLPGASVSEVRAGASEEVYLSPGITFDALAPVTLTDATTVAVDMGAGINFNLTLGGNRTLGNPTNPKPGQSGRIRVTQDGTGGRTLALASNWESFTGSIVLASGAGEVTILAYFVNSASEIEIGKAGEII